MKWLGNKIASILFGIVFGITYPMGSGFCPILRTRFFLVSVKEGFLA